jgi:hypothetical protein
MADIVYLTFHDNITLESANRVMDFAAKAITQYKPKKLYFLSWLSENVLP